MNEFIDKKVVIEALYQALRTQIQGTFTDSMSLAIDMANNLPFISLEKQMVKVKILFIHMVIQMKEFVDFVMKK